MKKIFRRFLRSAASFFHILGEDYNMEFIHAMQGFECTHVMCDPLEECLFA